MLLPRLDAISEVQWCRSDQKDFEDFKTRLPRMKQLYDRMGVNYCHGLE
jgi:hexosaminidase